MSVPDDPASSPPPWAGSIEPHALLLKQPPDDQVLYKVMSAENLVRCVSGRYLHFNRVDSYKDFKTADAHDGEQLSNDLPGNTGAKFTATPDFSVADYYNQSRARTYACCFSLENSKYIWDTYGAAARRERSVLFLRSVNYVHGSIKHFQMLAFDIKAWLAIKYFRLITAWFNM